MKKYIVGIMALVSLSSISGAHAGNDYVCKGTVINYSMVDGKQKVKKIFEKDLKVLGRDSHTRTLIVKPFHFSVIEPSSSSSVIKMTINDSRSKTGQVISEAIAAIPTNDYEAAIIAYADNGLVRLTIDCAAR